MVGDWAVTIGDPHDGALGDAVVPDSKVHVLAGVGWGEKAKSKGSPLIDEHVAEGE